MRWLKIAALVLGAIVLIVVAAVAVALHQVRTDEATQRWLGRELSQLASAPGSELRVARVGGSLLSHIVLDDIALSDRDGAWATIDHLEIDWSAAALIGARLVLRRIEAATVTVARAPAASESTSSSSGRLPLTVVLDRLAVDRLVLEAPLTGAPATLRLAGSAFVRPDLRELAAQLSAERIDGTDGRFALRLRPPGDAAGFALDLDYAEPAGGMLARLLALPDLPAVTVRLDGTGAERDWHGRLSAEATGLARLDAGVTLGLTDRLALALDGSVTFGDALPATIRTVLGDRADLSVAAERAADGQIDLTGARVVGPLGALTASGRVAPTLDVTATAALNDLARLSDVAGQPIDGALQATVHATGNPAAPTVDAAVRSDRLVAGPQTLSDLAANLAMTQPSGGPAVSLTGSVARVEVADRPPVEGLAWAIEAHQTSENLEVTRLEIGSPLATVTGSASLGLSQRQLDARLHIASEDLGLWRSITGMTLAGRTDIDLTIGGALDAGLEADATLEATGLATQIPAVDALLGGRLTGRLHLTRRADQTIQLDSIALDAADLTVNGGGELVGDQAHTKLRLAVPRLASLGPAVGTALRGNATAVVAIDYAPASTTARLTADATVNGIPVRLGARATRDPSRTALEDVRLEAAGAQITGTARLAQPSGAIDANLALAAPDLAKLSALVGTPVAGRLQGRVQLAGERAQLTLDATNLKASGAGIAKLTVSGTASDVLHAPRGRATAAVTGVQTSALALARTELKIEGTLDALTWSVDTSGQARQPVSLRASGQLSHRTEADRVTLRTLTGQFGAIPLRLEQPTTLERAADTLALGATRLDLGKGRVRIEASRRGDRLAAALDIEAVSLAALQSVMPIKLEGEVAGRARVGGTLAAPDADATLELRRLAPKGNAVAPVDGHVSAAWHGRQATVDGRLSGLADRPLSLTARVPIAYSAEPFSVAPAPDEPVSAHIEGALDLRRTAYVAGIDQPISGRAALDLTVGGTMRRPRVTGSAALADGRYADPSMGVLVDALAARLTADGNRVELASLTATDGHDGRISGRGSIDLGAADPAFEGSATLTKFAIQRNDVTSSADGTVRFGGSAKGGHVDGDLTIGKTEVSIPDRLPVTLVKLDVIEINGGPREPVQRPDAGAPSADTAVPIKLGLTITLPGPVLVRGRGLDSEWRGRLTIGGTAAKPEVQGRLTLVRGHYDFLGKTLALSDDSRISFAGGTDLEPFLDIKATATTTDLTATIEITGKASKPTLKITSDPPYPQDEILARVLFDKRVDQLSATEAIQLAQAVAQLTGGGGGGIVDRIRKATGLDVIDIRSADPNAPPGSAAAGQALTVGKYIGSGVLVTAEQGLTPSTSRAGVEVDLTKHLSVKTDVGAASDSRVGLNWKLDY